ncbi:anti-sigma B factor antagonist [Pantoea ananatis]|uniref:Intermembrane phospholipid transport system binding protein MlaB n=1 Tax=Pantoea ananas TaxID=553 RepID=A0AAJ1D430_PANAN|nr:lipid asymmetry maintenance protein MlaB [Pantoea ananatis]AWQ20255.1 STAS domain-containing protein [Pantoea ananatis]KGL53716.1 anti-sigma B factor antagonist [Pantoea ananatis]KTR49845.1 anti-sigma B factor antagonist [Pantoea ananatis]KTR55113.1 anti-sigma B factor antagonist [Pantoea ananatis]KTR66685.1 anti-sigma B factor antagonist [Pantoea ananatis]
MQPSLNWSREANTLRLEGELDRDTLLSLWEQREALVNAVELIDVSALQRVDSSGLALLVHLREISSQQGGSLRFVGIGDKLQSLVTLYNLQQIIVSAD